MNDLGRTLIILGGLVALIGVVFLLAGRANLPIGRLPGDIVYRGKNTTVYFPIVTSIILSIVLSIVLYLLSRFNR